MTDDDALMHLAENLAGLPDASLLALADVIKAEIEKRERVADLLQSRKRDENSMEAIAARVAFRRGVTVADLRGASRAHPIAHPRQEAYSLCREAGYSMPQIGRFFNRDHTTVLHGARAHRERAQ